MSTPTTIVDGRGTETRVGVTSNGALKVAIQPTPARDIASAEVSMRRYSSSFFEDANGADMNVDGSVASVDFSVRSVPDRVVYITQVRMIFHGGSMVISGNDSRRFSTAYGTGGMPNGIEFIAKQGNVLTNIFALPIKVLGDFYAYQDSFINDGDAVAVGVDFFMAVFNFDNPIVLHPALLDRLIIRVNDDLTALDLWNSLARGWYEAY